MHPRTSNSPSISAVSACYHSTCLEWYLSGHVRIHLLDVMSFFMQVVASQDWPEIATYAALASAQANGQDGSF